MKYDIVNSIASSKTLCMPHQQDAVDALNHYFHTDRPEKPQSGLIVMPTGSGKTFTTVNWLLNSGIAKGYRVLWLVHRQELVSQALYEFENQLGSLSQYLIKSINMMAISGSSEHYGMSQASRQDVYIASILSVASKNGQRFISRMLGAPGKRKLIVVIDEAHHAVAPSYLAVLKRIERLNPNRILLGLTATPVRMSDRETIILNELFNARQLSDKTSNAVIYKYIYEISLSELIKTGFLSKPLYKHIETEIIGDIEYDLNDDDVEVFNRLGDLTEALKRRIANSMTRNEIILNEYLANKDKYGKTLIFAINQLHAKVLSEMFNDAGINCDYAISDRPDSPEVIRRFKYTDELDILINVQMVTEGVDVPSIQTVFLTRETNSDSLIMQMIGRGLRGEKAGGTKEANIVSFHDQWHKIQFWMKPEFVMGEHINGDILDSNDPEIDEDEEEKTNNIMDIGINLEELFEKLYLSMRVNILSEVITDLIPDGWFSLLQDDGRDVNVTIYTEQLIGYQLLESIIPNILEKEFDLPYIKKEIFDGFSIKPTDKEILLIFNHILENEEMPEYFAFEERDKIDPKAIGLKMIAYSEKVEKQLSWLESYYKMNPIIEQLYRTFFAFKKSVMDSLEKPYEAQVNTMDDKEEFKIVPNYHDLDHLYNEVLQEYPQFNNVALNSLGWSKKVYKTWYGMCYKFKNGTYTIYINRLLCSPLVSEEAIKYLIYHELLHTSGLWNHGDEFREEEWSYPNSAELDGELDEIALRYNFDFDKLKKVKFEEIGIEKEKDIPLDLNTSNEPKEVDIGETPNKEARTHKYCRECGNKLPIKAKFCDVCGELTDGY